MNRLKEYLDSVANGGPVEDTGATATEENGKRFVRSNVSGSPWAAQAFIDESREGNALSQVETNDIVSHAKLVGELLGQEDAQLGGIALSSNPLALDVLVVGKDWAVSAKLFDKR